MQLEKSIFNKIKEAGSHTIIYGLGAVLQSALGFLLIPLYTRYYTTDMYGALSLINLSGMLAGTFFYLGASSALARSYYDYNDVYERKKVVSTSLYISLFGASLQILLGIALSGTISQFLFHDERYARHIALILISSAVSFVNTLFFMLLRFERKSKHVVALNIFSLVLTSSLIVFFLISAKLGVMAPILGGLISQGVLFIILLYLVRDTIVFDYSRHELKVQLPFGLQAVVIGMAYYSLDSLNRVFISKYGSLGDVGIYSLGYQIASLINILFIMPFGQIWAPMRMQYRNDQNADEFYRKILTYYTVIGLIITVMISLFSKEVITLFAGHKEYVDAYKVVPFVMIGLLVYGVVGLIDHGIYFTRKVIYHAFTFSIASVMSFVLNYMFVQRYGYLAAAAIIMVCYVTIVVLVFYISNRMYKIPYEGKRLALTGSIGVIALTAGYLIQFDQIYYVILFKSAVSSTMLLMICCYVLTRAEREKIMGLLGGELFWKRCEAKV